ncbi:hypothetical protein BMJ20_22375 [Sinorhizobium medicae]|nr:hypothetical protein BMJ22_34270 [Sinorhizobium medicae]PLU67164.1 hypothetical protein BMJ20_22375 [Sinorhizobium medicae]
MSRSTGRPSGRTARKPTESPLQRRVSYQTHTGRCSTLICCMFLSFNRIRLKETCSRTAGHLRYEGAPRRSLGADRRYRRNSRKLPGGFPSGIAESQRSKQFCDSVKSGNAPGIERARSVPVPNSSCGR